MTRTSQAKEAKTETCVICYDDNIDPYLMFSVDKCGHRFCLNCVKKHIEVKLLDGAKPNCPQNRCKSKFSIDRCGKFLSTKLSLIWKQRIKEDSTPFKERIYCPYERCSYLMSKTELSTSDAYGGLRVCFKCGGSFCVYCKVPWHRSLSCTDYKKLCPHPPVDDAMLKSLAKSKGWRQCGKCQHMVERSWGCDHIICRCGNVFCYKCGGEWDNVNHRRDCRYWFNHDFEVLLLWLFIGFILLMIFLGIGLCFYYIFVINKKNSD